MKNNKEAKVSYLGHHLTTIVSVTLVLLLAGIIALIWIGAEKETRRLKERIELSVIMADSIPDGTGAQMAKKLEKAPYAQNVKLVSREEALQNWKSETGEDLEEIFGVNPLSEEVEFGLKPEYTTPGQIQKIKGELEKEAGVEAVSVPDDEMVDSMNRNISRLTVILAVVAGIMLVISFVLINNTVHLTIYSRRFTIHTMQLVGATNGFIRRPVILGNTLAGLLSGLLASAVIAVALAGAKGTGLPDLGAFIGWGYYAAVAGGLVLAGMLLCALASLVSANTYLRKDYDSLFK